MENLSFVKLNDLPLNTTFQAKGEKEVNTRFGLSYILKVIVDEEPRLMWANKQLKDFLKINGKKDFKFEIIETYISHSGYTCFKLDLNR